MISGRPLVVGIPSVVTVVLRLVVVVPRVPTGLMAMGSLVPILFSLAAVATAVALVPMLAIALLVVIPVMDLLEED